MGFGKIEITVFGLLDFEELPVAMHMNTQVRSALRGVLADNSLHRCTR